MQTNFWQPTRAVATAPGLATVALMPASAVADEGKYMALPSNRVGPYSAMDAGYLLWRHHRLHDLCQHDWRRRRGKTDVVRMRDRKQGQPERRMLSATADRAERPEDGGL